MGYTLIPNPPSIVPQPGDHRAWAEWWGQHAVDAIARTLRPDNAFVDLEAALAVQVARLAWWHACRHKHYPYWDVVKRDELCR